MSVSLVSARAGTWRDCISPIVWRRVVSRIQKEESVSTDVAEQIMTATCQYLELCAKFPKQSHVPSKQVDIGWHAFLMYTREYADFCNRLGGHFIHHCPNDDQVVSEADSSQTVAFMLEQGIEFDPKLWNAAGQCTSSCHPSNDCGSGDCNSDSDA